MRILTRLAYDGHNFHGWQVQPGARTVQQVMEEVLADIAGWRIPVTGSGRTDAGVHALAQAAHFDWPLHMTPKQICLAMNCKLPPDIRCISASVVPDDFNARFDAYERRYRYLLEQYMLPHTRFYRSSMPRTPLRPERITDLLPVFLGNHDFAAFCRFSPDIPHTFCELREFSLHREGDHLRFELRANRFLHNMVRRLVGCVVTLAAEGLGADTAQELLEAKKAHPRLIPTAPPQGLYLTDVLYNVELTSTYVYGT